MKKIVINNCYGGFGLSDEAVELYFKYKGWNLCKEGKSKLFTNYFIISDNGERKLFNSSGLERDDHTLLRVVEELGEKANDMCASLAIVEIPDGVEWEISEYDGLEHVAERHRTWYAE